MLTDLESRLATPRDIADGPGEQIVPYADNQGQAVSHVLSTRGGSSVRCQIATLDTLCRVVAQKENKTKREVLSRLKEFVRQPPSTPVIDAIAGLVLPEGGVLRFVGGDLQTVRWQDPCSNLAQQRVAEMSAARGSSVGQDLLDWLDAQTRMVTLETCRKLPTVQSNCKPSYCFRFGRGTCLCTGYRIVIDIERVKSNHNLVFLCPPKSKARQFLTKSFLFACVQDKWFAIGLMYLNPVRATYLAVTHEFSDDSGNVALSVELDESKKPHCQTDIEMLESLDLQIGASIRLYKLLSFLRPHVPFTLGNIFTVTPLDKACAMPSGSEIRFWKGQDQEIADELERRRRNKDKADHEARAAKPLFGPRPKPAARPKPAGARPSQLPANSGVLLRPGPALHAAPLHDVPAAAAGPAASVVLLAAGDSSDDNEMEFFDNTDEDELPGGEGLIADWEAADGHEPDEQADASAAVPPSGHGAVAPDGRLPHVSSRMFKLSSHFTSRAFCPGILPYY